MAKGTTRDDGTQQSMCVETADVPCGEPGIRFAQG